MEATTYEGKDIYMEEISRLRRMKKPLTQKDSSGNGFYIDANDLAMKVIHALQLHMLIEIDRICREEGIEYYLLFGTLLGAVRHEGFIPWDDDIDIGVIREDYERLIRALSGKLDGRRYNVQCADIDPSVPIPYAKLRAKQTKFDEYGRSYDKLESGIFIDIFPLDNVPDSPLLRNRQKVKFFMTHFPRRVKHDNYRTRYLTLQYYYEKQATLSSKELWTKNLEAMTRYGHASSKLLIAYPAARSDYNTAFMSREDIKPASELLFCGHKVMAPQKVDAVLTKGFGNYMELPPLKSRRGHRLSYLEIDLRFWYTEIERYLPSVTEQHERAVKQIST